MRRQIVSTKYNNSCEAFNFGSNTDILNWVTQAILGDPGADKGGEGKSKRAEKYIRNEKK